MLIFSRKHIRFVFRDNIKYCKDGREKKEQKPHFDAVIVFGKEIEIPEEKFPKISEQAIQTFLKSLPEKPTVNKDYLTWKRKTRKMLAIEAKIRALGCLEILKAGDVNEVILTGGKTKGEEKPSEAALMRDYIIQKYQEELNRKFRKKEISEQEAKESLKEMVGKTTLEDKATNSLENFANVINILDEKPEQYHTLAFLSNQFHLSRISKLAAKFLLQGKTIPAEKKLKERSRHYNKFLEKACNPQNPAYAEILKKEKRWSRGLEEMPMYWLPQAVTVKKERLKAMFKADEKLEKALKERGLTTEYILSLDPEERKELREIPPEEWEETD